MQPFINPNLFLSPMYGNYMSNQMQPAPIQSVGISGKYVNDFGEITASDIPMSSPAIFAKNDRSEIQIREWNANGQITTTSYKMVSEQPKEIIPNASFDFDAILGKLDELDEKIERLSKPAQRAKKEVE